MIEPTRSKGGRRWWYIAIGLALIFLLSTLLIWVFNRGAATTAPPGPPSAPQDSTSALLAVLPLLLTALTSLVSAVGSISAVFLAWRADRRADRELALRERAAQKA